MHIPSLNLSILFPPSPPTVQHCTTNEDEKKLVRKIDFYLVPMLWVMYILNYIDRTNIGNARIAGMDDDLGLGDEGYAWILSIFFFGYLLCEVPSNMILSRSQPSIFLPGIMLLWGYDLIKGKSALCAVMSVSNSYGAMLGFRFVLGCIESGFFPGVLYLLSCWYKKAELGKRFALFYSAAIISGAFGGIFAGAVTGHLEGVHGIRGWRLLFIIEGVATVDVRGCMVGSSGLSHYDYRKRLTASEQDLAVGGRRMPRLSHWGAFLAAVGDWRTWAFVLLFVMCVGAGTISYFLPTLTKSLGYDTVKAQYMTVPIYIIATVFSNLLAYSTDRLSERRYHIAGALCGFISCVIAAAVPASSPAVRYAMICFTASGIWSALSLILAWTSKVIALPDEKRAEVLAIVNACGNFSSVYGSRIWPAWNGPGFSVGFGVTAGFLGAGTIVALVLPLALRMWPVKGVKPSTLQHRQLSRGA
ncbi:major facilitator superfamily transporter [Choiromyces venosus 120613-1]|uniref:Major facilitator superfamily transporter n=1 Tax=Choiromyces venosus 120613-1 TaxID=1336337 RepID=A0A3N4J9D8_9PEZI|nr:major facilitator superfamily transporter [Choiromyces venosus 120613-1]